MAEPRRTQKQISERYRGNLGYYNRLRSWVRARFIVSLLAVLAGLFAIFLFQRHGHETFFNPGKISTPHAKFADNCAKCHDQSLMTGGPLTPAKFKQVVSDRFHSGIAFGPIDRKCEACHTHHVLHEPDVVQNRSCSACHQEHRGLQSLTRVASSNCASCHNNSATMEASSQKGMQLNWANFHRHPHSKRQVVFDLPRPPRGYTQTFPSFWNGHPEFQLDREKVRDPDVLRFNHQRHFASDIPPVNGKKLDCAYCHQPDLDGRYYQRITFASNCQTCHSLQFDPKNPELTLPHGSAAAVRAFLRTLPTQYAELAVKKGITRQSDIRSFVAKQMTQLRDRVRTGRKPGARSILYNRSLQTTGGERAADAGLILRLRFLSRSEAGCERRGDHYKTDFGRSLDAAGKIQSLQTSDRSEHAKAARLQRLPSRRAKPRNVRRTDACESNLRHLSQPAGKSGG